MRTIGIVHDPTRKTITPSTRRFLLLGEIRRYENAFCRLASWEM